MKTHKPGDLFNAFQAKKKRHEEKKHEKHKKTNFGLMQFGDRSVPSVKPHAQGNANSTVMGTNPKYFKKHRKHMKHRKERSAEAIKGMREFVSEEAKEKKHRKHEKHKKNWIAGAIKHPGALHRELGVKAGHKIPAKTLAKAANKGGIEDKRARLSQTLKGFHHKHHKHETSKHCKTCSC